MRYLVLTLTFVLFFATGFFARAAEDPELIEALKDCDQNQRTMNLCAEHKHKLADRELNELYQMQMKRLLSATNRDRLRAAQKAWIVFRDKDCLYQAREPGESGSIWGLEHYSCMEYHTKKRIEDLKKFIECTDAGCPE